MTESRTGPGAARLTASLFARKGDATATGFVQPSAATAGKVSRRPAGHVLVLIAGLLIAGALAAASWYALGGKGDTATAPKPAPPSITTARTPPPLPAPVPHKAGGAASKPAWRLQIISLSSRQAVGREWARLKAANPDLLRGLTLTVSPNRSGSLFRMRLGPLAGRKAARRLCAGLKRRQTDCLILAP
jgi:hypothetical protein